MPITYKLHLSQDADNDLNAIYEYGFGQWGEAQADAYYDALINHFKVLCDNPFLYAAIDDIRVGYRRSVCGAHSIYYRVTGEAVQIMAIIGRQDIKSRL